MGVWVGELPKEGVSVIVGVWEKVDVGLSDRLFVALGVAVGVLDGLGVNVGVPGRAFIATAAKYRASGLAKLVK